MKGRRFRIQLAAAALLNGYWAGFARGRVFTGKSKLFCVPVLNCYACPGALGACPIGALQTVLSGPARSFPFYVLGTLTLFGVVLGRVLCGFFCPFGLVQDLLARIPVRKLRVPRRADRPARLIKYLVLAALVILLPLLAAGSSPWFCQYLCPAGTLEGGIPLLLKDSQLRSLAGTLFHWKLALLLLILGSAALIPRSFCRYLCPLGAFYGLFHRFSLYRLAVDRDRCVDCGRCEAVCPMAVEVPAHCDSPECIRCGGCVRACPAGALRAGFLRDPAPGGHGEAPEGRPPQGS